MIASTQSSRQLRPLEEIHTWRDYSLHPTYSSCKDYLHVNKLGAIRRAFSPEKLSCPLESLISLGTVSSPLSSQISRYRHWFNIKQHQEQCHESLGLLKYKNALYCADPVSHGAVIRDGNGDYNWIEDTRINFPFHLPYDLNWKKTRRDFYASTAFVASLQYGNNYFHWLCELVPKLYVGSVLLKQNTVNTIILDDIRHEWQFEILKLLEIPEDSVWIGRNSYMVHAETLYVCNARIPVMTAALYSKHVLNKALNKASKCIANGQLSSQFIYVSRNDSQTRNVINSRELRSMLHRIGFDVITLNGLTIEVQRDIFSRASVAIFEHGASEGNLLFMQKESIAIEICPPQYCCDLYTAVADAMGIIFWPFTLTCYGDDKSNKDSNYYIDILMLEKFAAAACRLLFRKDTGS